MTFPENIKFKYSWRKYQQRVLDDLQEHLEDRHLHVVAPLKVKATSRTLRTLNALADQDR